MKTKYAVGDELYYIKKFGYVIIINTYFSRNNDEVVYEVEDMVGNIYLAKEDDLGEI